MEVFIHGLPDRVPHVKLLGMDVLREKKVGPAVAIAGMLVVAVVYMRWQGRVWWCEQGGVDVRQYVRSCAAVSAFE